jgi:hypothetical protein
VLVDQPYGPDSVSVVTFVIRTDALCLLEVPYMFLLEQRLQARPSKAHTLRRDAVVSHLDALERGPPSRYEETTPRVEGSTSGEEVCEVFRSGKPILRRDNAG